MGILIKIALIGLLAWLLIEFIPMPAHVQKVIFAVAVLLAILLALPLLNSLLTAI